MISSSPGHWAILRGVACATLSGKLSDNPYTVAGSRLPDAKLLARCWRYGCDGRPPRNVARETLTPGWSRDQLRMLELCWSARDDVVADLVGKSINAVRIKRTRLRATGHIPADAA